MMNARTNKIVGRLLEDEGEGIDPSDLIFGMDRYYELEAGVGDALATMRVDSSGIRVPSDSVPEHLRAVLNRAESISFPYDIARDGTNRWAWRNIKYSRLIVFDNRYRPLPPEREKAVLEGYRNHTLSRLKAYVEREFDKSIEQANPRSFDLGYVEKLTRPQWFFGGEKMYLTGERIRYRSGVQAWGGPTEVGEPIVHPGAFVADRDAGRLVAYFNSNLERY